MQVVLRLYAALCMGLVPFVADARARCPEHTPSDNLAWSPLSRSHPASSPALRWMRALAARDERSLVKRSGLPLLVRYPLRYDAGRVVEYRIDERAVDVASRAQLLGRLLLQFPRSSDGNEDEDVLLPSRHADLARIADRAIRVRLCPEVHADGTYDWVELTLRQDVSGEWLVHAIEVTWHGYD